MPSPDTEGRREVRVRLYPDGEATGEGAGKLSAEIRESALVYINIGDREIGINFKPKGRFDIWVHDDVESNSPRRFTYKPEPFEEATDAA